MASFLGIPKVQYFKSGTSEPLVGGKLYSYISNTTTLSPTYPTLSDANALTNPNSNPVVLDSRGEALVVINRVMRLVLTDANDALLWTQEGVADKTQAGGVGLLFVLVSSGVNRAGFTSTATGDPIISTDGTDTNIGLILKAKGSGSLSLDAGTSGGINLNASSSYAIHVRRAASVTGTLTGTAAKTGAFVNLTTGAVTNTGSLSSGTTSLGGLTTTDTSTFDFLPTGMICWITPGQDGTGWLECGGQAISRTTYATLFSTIGTLYGVGDGSTTFNVPDMSRRTLIGAGGTAVSGPANTVGATGGAESHTLSSSEMPAHNHTATANNFLINVSDGGGIGGYISVTYPASTSTGGGGAHDNMQPSIALFCVIKSY